jgi:hypothetical protein
MKSPITLPESTGDKQQPKVKRLQVRFFSPGNTLSRTRHFCAPAGKVFTQDGIDLILENCVRELEDSFPGEEYRLVELSDDTFNFVWVETKVAAKSA